MAGYRNGIRPVIGTVSARVFHSLEGGLGVMGDHASTLVPGSQITAFSPRVPACASHHADLLACLHRPDSMETPHSGIQLDAIQYPAWANYPYASWLVTAASASAMACSKASSVRAAWARTSALTLDHHSSIGDKSGAYGGR
jgi:hypothetical protein